jgi:hypothetical protein
MLDARCVFLEWDARCVATWGGPVEEMVESFFRMGCTMCSDVGRTGGRNG